MGAMSKTLFFAIPAASLNAGGCLGEQRGPRRGCIGARVRSVPAVSLGSLLLYMKLIVFGRKLRGCFGQPGLYLWRWWMSGRVHACAIGVIQSCLCGARGCPSLSCGDGGCVGGAARRRGLARIFAIAFGGLRLGLRGCAGPHGPCLL